MREDERSHAYTACLREQRRQLEEDARERRLKRLAELERRRKEKEEAIRRQQELEQQRKAEEERLRQLVDLPWRRSNLSRGVHRELHVVQR